MTVMLAEVVKEGREMKQNESNEIKEKIMNTSRAIYARKNSKK